MDAFGFTKGSVSTSVNGCVSEWSNVLAEELRVTVADAALKVFSEFAN